MLVEYNYLIWKSLIWVDNKWKWRRTEAEIGRGKGGNCGHVSLFYPVFPSPHHHHCMPHRRGEQGTWSEPSSAGQSKCILLREGWHSRYLAEGVKRGGKQSNLLASPTATPTDTRIEFILGSTPLHIYHRHTYSKTCTTHTQWFCFTIYPRDGIIQIFF